MSPRAPFSIFNHVNNILTTKIGWKDLTDADKKSWNSYMIIRILSMDANKIPFLNDIQHLQQYISPEAFLTLLNDSIPKGRSWYPYIKKVANSLSKEEIEVVLKHYQCSYNEAVENVLILNQSEEGKSQLQELLRNYGYKNVSIKKKRKSL